jgi:serine/threonine-protein kinase HipA
MTDYRSLEKLEIYKEDEQVATLTRLPQGCEFRYEPNFLASTGLSIARHLPKQPEPLVTQGILNLPPYFAGLLPEGVMLTAAQTLIRSAKDDLFSVLAATGRDAVGDVDVRVPGAPSQEPSLLNLESAKNEIESILDRTGGRANAISAIAGVQPKMSLGGIVRASRDARYIAKFPSPDFPGLPENEAACMALARKCGLQVPTARVDKGVYIVERFDRVPVQNGPVKKIHVEDMLQVMNLFPNRKYGLDFVELCQAMENLGVSIAGILEVIKLYAFSYIVGNGDLHAKNVSLIRKPDGQWIPSPAYDIVSTLPYKASLGEAMALALADEALGRFEISDFTDFGMRFGIPEKACKTSIMALAQSALKFAPSILSGLLPEEDVATVLSRASSLAG